MRGIAKLHAYSNTLKNVTRFTSFPLKMANIGGEGNQGPPEAGLYGVAAMVIRQGAPRMMAKVSKMFRKNQLIISFKRNLQFLLIFYFNENFDIF